MSLLRRLKALFTAAPRATPADRTASLQAGTALLIDVREPREWEAGVAQSAALLPLSDLLGARAHWKPFLEAHAAREFLLYCAVGGRSGIAARILVAEGYRAANAGSLADWVAAGWALERPPRRPA